jgi:hypothetical protein
MHSPHTHNPLVGAGLEVLEVGAALLNHGARVGDAAALDLQVGQALQVVVRQRLGTLRSRRAQHGKAATAAHQRSSTQQ